MDVVSSLALKVASRINFGCDIQGGVCSHELKRKVSRKRPLGKMLCCNGCHHNVGYLRIKKEELPNRYSRYFIPHYGFWRPNGCRLPLEMRSSRCVLYSCSGSNMSNEDRKTLLKLEKVS